MERLFCKRCIMDNSNDPDLELDQQGVCNHCKNFDKAVALLPLKNNRALALETLVEEIRKNGKGKKYDCILGVSGGVDSTYLAYKCKEFGLRTLLVHCDNGWNTELSVKNIENICYETGFELFTHVIDWEEMKDLQQSFMKAGVVDLELPYDYALTITMYQAARKFGVISVLTGHNVETEGTYLPRKWRHDKNDIVNILSIHKRFGKVKLRSFPKYSIVKQILVKRKLKYYNLLNYLEYNKAKVKEIIIEKMNWRDYGGKHYENIFTRFYQGYILKEKFGFDKRQFHLSILVQSGQMSRETAIKEYSLPAYPDIQRQEDMNYVLKKLELTQEEFDDYMQAPRHHHEEYGSIKKYWDHYFHLVSVAKRILGRHK